MTGAYEPASDTYFTICLMMSGFPISRRKYVWRTWAKLPTKDQPVIEADKLHQISSGPGSPLNRGPLSGV